MEWTDWNDQSQGTIPVLSSVLNIVHSVIILFCQEIDVAAADLSISYARSRVADFTYPFANDQLVLMIPYPRLASTISGVVKPFNYKVSVKSL